MCFFCPSVFIEACCQAPVSTCAFGVDSNKEKGKGHLEKLDAFISMGLDGNHLWVLKELVDHFCIIREDRGDMEEVPYNWEKSNVTHLQMGQLGRKTQESTGQLGPCSPLGDQGAHQEHS